jgi:hypothetical protein
MLIVLKQATFLLCNGPLFVQAELPVVLQQKREKKPAAVSLNGQFCDV